MATEQTLDEEQGAATQLELDLSDAAVLRHELDLIPSHDFAAALGIAEQTLAGWRCADEGPPFIKIGKAVYYRRVLVKPWLDQLAEKQAA